MQIANYILQKVKYVNNNTLLEAMADSCLTPEQWMVWGLSRWRISWGFERFLFGAIRQAERAHLASLVQVLRQNLDDEMGVDAQGNLRSSAAHEAWRQRFYGAVGLQYDQMQCHVNAALATATQYCARLEQILILELPLVTAGALWFLEVNIPDELISVAAGCRSLGLSAADMEWVTDHMMHDPLHHAASLAQAVDELAGQDKCLQTLVLDGVDRAAEAKSIYFQEVVKHLGL